MTRTFGRRRFLQSLTGGTAAILVAACASGSSAGGGASSSAPTAAPKSAESKPAESTPAAPAKPAAAQGTATGTFWFNQPIQQEAFQKIIDRFHEKQQRVKMEVVLVPQTDIATKLATAIAGGEPPDAVRLGGPALNALFINNKHAAVLDDWDPKIGTYDWIPSIKKAVSRDGKMYALPVNSGAMALIYNKELYQKVGLDPEKPPTTLDQLVEVADKVARAGGGSLWGHYLPTAPSSQTGSDYFMSMVWEYGGTDISDDGTKVVYNSPETVAAFEWLKKLVDAKGLPAKQINETNMLNDYLTGNVGSMFAYPALVARVAGASFKSGSVALPAGPKGSIAPIGFGSIMVMDKGKNREAGWEFAKFIGLDASNDAFWNVSFGQLPPRPSFRDDAAWKEYEAKNPLVPAYLEGQKGAELLYFGAGAQEIATEMGKAVEAVVFAQKSPKQAVDDAAKASQTILDRERQKSG